MPNKKLKKVLRYLLVLTLILIALVAFDVIKHNSAKTPTQKSQTIPTLDYHKISNSSENWGIGCCGKISGYELDYAKIETISFAKNGNDLYVRHNLKGIIPDGDNLPSIGNDKLTHLIYRIAIDKNYTDDEGNINPGGFDIHMKISFYGDAIVDEESGVQVKGELIEGGEGYDYFITKYPYDQLFFNQVDSIVFSADALIVTKDYPGGVTAFIFNNIENAADRTGEKIKLSFM